MKSDVANGRLEFNLPETIPQLTVQTSDGLPASITVYNITEDTLTAEVESNFYQADLVNGNEYTVSVKRDGYHRYDLPPYALKSNLVIVVPMIREDSQAALLTVVSEPNAARVYIDGLFFTITPGQAYLPAGSHAILVEKEGYRPESGSLELAENEVRPLSYNLSKLTEPTGYLDVDLNVPARIDTVGVQNQRAPFRVGSVSQAQLPPGEYNLFFTYGGYADTSAAVTVHNDSTTQLTMSLRRILVNQVFNPVCVIKASRSYGEQPYETTISLNESYDNTPGGHLTSKVIMDSNGVVLSTTGSYTTNIMTPGTHYFYGTVTNNNGLSHTNWIAVTLGSPPADKPIARAKIYPGSGQVPLTITIDGSESVAHPNAEYEWFYNGETISNQVNDSYFLTSSDTGSHYFTLKVTNPNGQFDLDDERFDGVGAETKVLPPVCKMTANPSSGVAPFTSTINLSQSYTNTDGSSIKEYIIEDSNGERLNPDNAAQVEITQTVPGYYTYYGTVVDNYGLKDSDKVSVLIYQAEEPEPTTGILRITSSPSGALVSFPGHDSQYSPARWENLEPGDYDGITVELTGHITAYLSAEIIAGQVTHIHVPLLPELPPDPSRPLTIWCGDKSVKFTNPTRVIGEFDELAGADSVFATVHLGPDDPDQTQEYWHMRFKGTITGTVDSSQVFNDFGTGEYTVKVINSLGNEPWEVTLVSDAPGPTNSVHLTRLIRYRKN